MIFDLSDFNIPRPHSLFMGYVEVGERTGSIFMRRNLPPWELQGFMLPFTRISPHTGTMLSVLSAWISLVITTVL